MAPKRRSSSERTSQAPIRPVPPPITASIYLPARSRPSSQQSTPYPSQPQPWYQRKAARLQADLQVLLDAQATRLADPSSAPPPSSSSSTTSDPLSRTTSQSRAIPSDPTTISLRAARAGLYTTMRRLAALKNEEIASAEAAASSVTASHEQVLAWASKRERLRARAEEIAAGPDADTVQELRGKADAMQPEITELEDRLAKLRNEQKRLRREAEETQNRVEAKLSSYTRGLEGLDREARDFLVGLKRESEEVMFDVNTKDEDHAEDDMAFWELAPKRRTLEMARDVLGREREKAEGRLDVAETEKKALLEGAVVWKDVVKLVEGFERALRADMEDIGTGPEHANQRLQDTLTAMDGVLEQLDSQIRLAEARSWKLLIAAIGAEQDAFAKGKEVLQQALGCQGHDEGGLLMDGLDDDEPGVNSVIRSLPAQQQQLPDQESHDGVLEELDGAFARGRSTARSHDTDEDDDGPDPELMISHHDTDTD